MLLDDVGLSKDQSKEGPFRLGELGPELEAELVS